MLILVDYAGFNLRMAKFAKEHGIKVFYYISPKIWAWNQGRVEKVKARVDKMFVILPFEKEFYQKFGYDVDYTGNPTADAVAEFEPTADFFAAQPASIPTSPLLPCCPARASRKLRRCCTR